MRSLIFLFFSRYISYLIKKDFSVFSWNRIDIQKERSILMIANHFSWWDGFLMFHLNKLFFKKKFHVMVSEDNYRDFFFLKYLGAFPVKKNSRQMLESLKHAGELLKEKDNLVLIFPQGKLYSSKVDEIAFEKGLERIIRYSHNNFQYVFAATFVDYFEKRKPGITCYLDKWNPTEEFNWDQLPGAYNRHYQTSREKQSRITV